MTLSFISHPVYSLQGEITPPGDKSMSHRAIILGAIATGKTQVHGFLHGEDCMATLRAFELMGVRIEKVDADKLVIHGVGKYGLQPPKTAIDCGNSGTSMRLLAGLLAAQSFDSELVGDESLSLRPMARIQRPLTQVGAVVSTTNSRPPLRIQGDQSLQGITYIMPEASAQVKSCLLLAGMYAQGETRIIEPIPTRDHTERMLMSVAYPCQRLGNELIINGQHQCKGTDIFIPGDMSSAAFFIVAATLIPDSDIWIKNVSINPTRTGVLEILTRMGAKITLDNMRQYAEEPVADLHVRYAPLKGVTIPEFLVPATIDEFPALFIAAACAKGDTLLKNAKELRSKESDRICAMAEGLQRLGIHAQPLDDGMLIRGGSVKGGEVDSWGDHRIAMAFAIAGAVAKAPVTVRRCDSVATSFPNFTQLAKQLNLLIRVENNE